MPAKGAPPPYFHLAAFLLRGTTIGLALRLRVVDPPSDAAVVGARPGCVFDAGADFSYRAMARLGQGVEPRRQGGCKVARRSVLS